MPRTTRFTSLAVALALGLIGNLGGPALVAAQVLSNPDRAPTEPTANDPSVGIPSSPATTASTPVPLKPDAARKDGAGGTAPDANVPARDKR